MTPIAMTMMEKMMITEINRILYKTVILVAAATSFSAYARINCINNTWNFQKRYDNKEYHLVECLCPCADTLERCQECGHLHLSQSWKIISERKKQSTITKKESAAHLPIPNTYAVLKHLVQTHPQEYAKK